ncbi:outer membrane lipid asymmetry maintenance protein MlaD [Mesobacterium pallidum]|uniref:outer membrane lipid asymmetry maintenance protein MlaD n=1 Tax=Mesobacterium pallidum TaxID=2872037 RepID=UPI001EE1EFDC|nr:outer membrane lipid asymmetry maintenance protein MlaD [Mesobacterium pallidum]
MAGETTEALVGGAVLAAAAGFVIYAAQATGFGGGGSDTYDLTASFRSLEGVTLGTDVRLAGVKVGTVAGIELNAETYRAETRLTLQDGIQVPDDSAAVVASEGLLGGNFVEIVPGGSPFYFAAGDEIIDTQGAVSLISLLLKYVGGGSDQ